MGSGYFVLYITIHILVLVYGQGKLSTDKPVLRYGFQKTKECQDFQRAYLCVRKCIDLKYDVAHSDKNCACTCYKRQDKSKYTSVVIGNSTKWRLGAPTTSLPAWAKPKHELSEKGIPEMNHEMGGISGEQGAQGDTSAELGKPTDIAVKDETVSKNTAVDSATNTEVTEGVTSAVSADDAAASAPTSVAAAT